MNQGYREVGKTYERQLTRMGDGVRLEVDGRVPRADFIDEKRQAVGQIRIGDLEDVLGVQLAGVGQVEAADEDDVVRDRDFGGACSRARIPGRRASSVCP